MEQTLFRVGRLVTLNANDQILKDAFLRVENGKIKELGAWKEELESSEWVDFRSKIVMPGLFSLHGHLPMVMFRGISEGQHLMDWLNKTIFPLETKWTIPRLVRVGGKVAAAEYIRHGVTFCADMYMLEDILAETLDETGIRALIAESFFDHGNFGTKGLDHCFKLSEQLIKDFSNHPRILPGLAPHSPYLCSKETLERAAKKAKEWNCPVQIHVAESQDEIEIVKKHYRKSPVQFLESTGLLDCERVLAAHSLWLDDQDLSIYKEKSITPVLNPQCNAKLASGYPPVNQFLQRDIRFALGTDGAASNNALDIFSELNFLAKFHNFAEQTPKSIPSRKLLKAATIDSARALGLDSQLGSLEVGKQADFICLDRDFPSLLPETDLYNHLIFNTRGAQVTDVFISGEAVLRNTQHNTISLQDCAAEANSLFQEILSESPGLLGSI